MDLVFNESSLVPKAANRVEATRRMALLVETVRAARRHGAFGTLRTCGDFWNSELTEGYTIAAWGADGGVPRDSRVYVKTLAGRAPFIETLFAEAEGESLREFQCGGEVCRGLGLALMRDWPAVSVAVEPWTTDPLTVLCRAYVEADTGGSVIETAEDACNFFEPNCAQRRADWVSQRLQRDIQAGRELLARAVEVLTELEFTDTAVRQVEAMSGSEPVFRQVVRHVFALAAAIRGWDGAGPPLATLSLPWSPESEATLNRYGAARTFRCPDGRDRQFSSHTKIGIDAWRIHFIPLPERRQVLVGYIGPHLPTAT